MAADQNGHTLFRHFAQDFPYRELIAEVQRACGLIQQNEGRLLRHGSGYEHKLALSAGKLIACRVGQSRDADALHGLFGSVPVPASEAEPALHMGRTAHEHHVADKKGERLPVLLRNVGHMPCQCGRLHVGNVDAPDVNAALFRMQKPHAAAEQRGFAAAVGAEQSADLSRTNGKTDVVQYLFSSVGKGKSLNVERMFRRRLGVENGIGASAEQVPQPVGKAVILSMMEQRQRPFAGRERERGRKAFCGDVMRHRVLFPLRGAATEDRGRLRWR